MIVDKVIDDNPSTVEKIRKGNQGPINFLLGQVMKEMKGQGDPTEIKEEIL